MGIVENSFNLKSVQWSEMLQIDGSVKVPGVRNVKTGEIKLEDASMAEDSSISRVHKSLPCRSFSVNLKDGNPGRRYRLKIMWKMVYLHFSYPSPTSTHNFPVDSRIHIVPRRFQRLAPVVSSQ
jgi:hypothetical protein